MFIVYMIGLLIHFINGNEFNTTDTIHPFKNNHVGEALGIPLGILIFSVMVAFTWVITVPVLSIVLIALPFRAKTSARKKCGRF